MREEARVTENSRTIAAAALGAVGGAVAGYLFFTDRGRELRRRLEPAFEDITRELSSFRTTAEKLSAVASQTWTLLNEVVGEREPSRPPRYPSTHQTAPF